ncbi:unnamed protein product, partial [Pleuronectes platessa]
GALPVWAPASPWLWGRIGSIFTRSPARRPPPPNCRVDLLSDKPDCCHQTAISSNLSRPTGLKRFYSLSYMWYSAFNCFTVIVIGLIISFLTGPMKEEDVTPGTVFPLMGKLLCFLPEHLKKKLCCVTPLGQTLSTQQTLPPQSKENNGSASRREDGASQDETESFLPDAQTPYVEHETAV